MEKKNGIRETLTKLGLVKKDELEADTLQEVDAVVAPETAVPEINPLDYKAEAAETPASVQAVNLSSQMQDSVIEKKLDNLIESYEKNKLMSIEDIYRKYSLETDVKRTIFMADIYMKALPENLPIDIKRDSVHNIMNASDIKIDDLMNDAYKRIDSLNNVLESVVATTEEMRSKNMATVKDLEKRIEELKRTIVERDKFQDTQNTTIEYEIQRVINIVDFIKPKK